MRAAFTLIEVIVAVAIATISGAGLLQMNTNSLSFFQKIHDKAVISETLSLVGAHADARFNKTTKSLDDILDRSYDIKNDALRTYLKEQKFDYNEVILETISLDGSDFGEGDGEDDSEDTREEVDPSEASLAPTIQFEIVQVSIKNKTQKGYILQVREFN